MAGGVIGDAYLHSKHVTDMLDRKTKMVNSQAQANSGLKYTKARELGVQIAITKTLQTEKKFLEGFVEHNKTAVKTRVSAEEAVIRNVQKIAASFKESLVSFNDGLAKDSTSFLVVFKQYMKSLESECNVKVGGSYLLGGTITDISPIDLSKVPDGLDPASGVTLDYYNGNSSTVSIVLDSNNDLDFDLLGSLPAFEKLIRALKIATDPSIASGDARATAAQDLTDEALVEFSNLVSQVGSKDEGLDTLIEAQENRILYLTEAHGKIVEADETGAAMEFMNDERVLSMTYAMLKRMNEMSLVDYIK
jgi:flagellar hook-associated protein 3 FlgL